MMRALRLVVSIFVVALPAVVKAVPVNIVSDKTWTVSDSKGNYLSNAQNVCLNATAPSNCPAGAASYGYPLLGWTVNLSSMPGATWIWAPSITGATSSAADAEFTFQKEFYLCGAPSSGIISLSADDSAEVFLNGASVASSTTHSALSTFPVPASKLAQGLNIIQVKVKNGPNPPGCGSGLYRCNPAGVVMGASFADALSAWPTCTGNNGKIHTVGQFETLSCAPGHTGALSRPCICIGSSGFWGPTSNTCALACTGNNGRIFSSGDTETLACPPELIGSASRICQPNGSWGPTNTSTCVPPQMTCAGIDGRRFVVGMSETLACPPGKVGSQSRTCQPDGSWGSTSGTCTLPPVCAGCVCGSRSVGQTGICPSGMTCGSRLFPIPPRSFWCSFLGINCPTRLQSTDWFCDP
jgi:hypothetical protein